MKIIDIEGIGEVYSKKLIDNGIDQVEDLLNLTKKEIEELAEKTGIDRVKIDTWQEHADLIRLKGVGPEYAELLNKIGIDSVKELARRVPANTHAKMEEFDKEQPDVVRRLPSLESVEEWIQEAKKLS